MNVLYYYAIAFIIIWILALAFKDKLKIDVSGPLLMRRTKRLRGFIESIANLSPRFWRWFMNIGIPIAFFFMFLMVALLLYYLPTTFISPQASIILPGVDIPGSQIFVPFGYGIIALMTLLVVHEFGHGIIARVEGVRIKSIGVLLLAVLPGAFVEPDEEDVEKSEKISKLRIYAAGSVFNLGLAAISLIIFLFITVMTIGSIGLGIPGINIPGTSVHTEPIQILNVSGPIYPTFHNDGMLITSVVPNSPADGILKDGMVIQSINGVQTNNFTDYFGIVNETKIGQVDTIQTNEGTFTVKTGVNPNNASRGYVGVFTQQDLAVNSNVEKTLGIQIPWFIYDLSQLFYWILLLNFAVGIFNLLPMKPLDGGLMLEELLGYKLSDIWVNRIITPLSYILILIIVFIIGYSLLRGLFLLL